MTVADSKGGSVLRLAFLVPVQSEALTPLIIDSGWCRPIAYTRVYWCFEVDDT
ncbi:hypothetical protein NIES39_L01240 [Arthrospira platensis NIES-39]|nr:hypothetical protein NIES39_L01240 [Arthrospira platensis NIES-39]